METIVQSNQQLAITEDSSDRSESSSVSQEYQSRGFEDYDIVKRLKQSVGSERGIVRGDQNLGKIGIGFGKQYQTGSLQFDEVNVSIGKSKDYSFTTEIGDALNYQLDKSRDIEMTTKEPTVKETFLNLSRDARQRYINAGFERSPKELNYLVEREMKEYGFAKGYNLPLERMKEFNLPLERMRDNRMTVMPRERLSSVGMLENSRVLDGNNHRNLHVQPRSGQDLEPSEYERTMRRHHNLLNRMDFAAQNLIGAQLPHSRQTSVAQIQQTQQEHQQQQIKSFTIDAILAHRNNQKERQQRNQQQQQLRKARQECQEVVTKSGTSCTGNGNGGGKAKRVRTIFTAEQLERLEGEFARQQYMVGPERLYLAHALRLTEAQVKVWFQNRRIKWRKVNHEQQCQAVNEHRQRCSLPSLEIHEDESNETNGKWCNSTIAVGEDSHYDICFIMDKCDKRRGKYGSNHANSLIAKYRNSGDVEMDNCRKCRQGNELSGTHERNDRKQSNPPIDPTASFYCSTESYRPQRHHGTPSVSRTKYLLPSVPQASYRTDHTNLGILKPFRNHPLFANNVAIVRKNRYKDEPDEEEVFQYGNEILESAEDDNAEEENREEVAEENYENGSEFNDKDYEEQEADDEVDEESDAIERQVENLRIQKKTRIEQPPRNHQRISSIEPSQHHRGQKNLTIKPPARCRHNVADRDPIDIPTEEEEEEPEVREPEPLPSRKSGWRPALHHERDTWNHSRNVMERYADLNRSSVGSAQHTRRPRTTRPEVETSMRSGQLESVHSRKCSRCTTSSGHAPKTTSSRNATCRLQDSRYLIRESNGDEGEDFEDPEPPMTYHTKSRKSKESRSPIYNPREDGRNFDAEIGAIYNSCNPKNVREPPNGYRERTKHFVRASNRHDSSSATLNHENRYWP